MRWLLLLIALPFLVEAAPVKVNFFKGNLSSAKDLAAKEGKLYFAEFSASWCAPCRVLEETTFSDPTVVDYISKNYIPVKVDIDAFDGIALKQVYNVQTIPTIIVFNSQGRLLEKYDQALPTSKMIALLKKHNIPNNRIKTQSFETPASQKPDTETINQTTTYSSNQPLIRETHNPMRQADTNPPNRPDKQPVTPIRVESTPFPTKPLPQGDGLYRFEVRHQASQGFSVQIGAFKEYGNVLREVARVQDSFDQPIIVHILRTGDQAVYKIMIGEFGKRQEAISYQAKMKQLGVEGVIKDLSTMK